MTFCKVANELGNKSPEVTIAVLHLVMGEIACMCMSLVCIVTFRKTCSTDTEEM